MDCLKGTPKVFVPIRDYEHYKNFQMVLSQDDTATKGQRQKIVQRLKDLKEFDQLRKLFKLYNNVSLEKLAKLLKLDSKSLNDLLDRYLKRRRINFNNESALYQTVLTKLFGDVKETQITIKDNRISIHEPKEEVKDYS